MRGRRRCADAQPDPSPRCLSMSRFLKLVASARGIAGSPMGACAMKASANASLQRVQMRSFGATKDEVIFLFSIHLMYTLHIHWSD